MIHTKVAGTVVAGAAAAVVVAILNQSGVAVSADLSTAITVLVGAVGGYWSPAEDKAAQTELDPVFSGVPAAAGPGELVGDGGAPDARRPDPRDEQIAALQAQLMGRAAPVPPAGVGG